jgi:hypothetical protein
MSRCRFAGRFVPRPRNRDWCVTVRNVKSSQAPENRIMRVLIALTALALLVVSVSAPAEAKGCLKGAVVGGVAGHYAGHHGMLGAAAGCLYGRHRAKEQEQQQQHQRAPQHQSGATDIGQTGM